MRVSCLSDRAWATYLAKRDRLAYFVPQAFARDIHPLGSSSRPGGTIPGILYVKGTQPPRITSGKWLTCSNNGSVANLQLLRLERLTKPRNTALPLISDKTTFARKCSIRRFCNTTLPSAVSGSMIAPRRTRCSSQRCRLGWNRFTNFPVWVSTEPISLPFHALQQA